MISQEARHAAALGSPRIGVAEDRASERPAAFPAGTVFSVMDGVPVTETREGEFLGWDCCLGPRRMWPAPESRRVQVSEEIFKAVVEHYRSFARRARAQSCAA